MDYKEIARNDGLYDSEKCDFVTLEDFCKRYHLNYEVAKARKKMGWSPDEIKEGMTREQAMEQFTR